MIQFLHLSDLHIREGSNDELHKRLSYIRMNYPRHCKIITGDVTNDGSMGQYLSAVYCTMNGKECYICPGNHDYGYAGNLYEKKRAQRFDEFLPQKQRYHRLIPGPVVDVLVDEDSTVVLIGLDSNLRTHNPLDFACGRIGWIQRYRLKKVLIAARRKYPHCVRIVYFHHHPFDRGPWTGMKDAEKLMKVLLNCELTLFGHKHEAQQWGDMAAAGKLSVCDEVTEITIDDGKITLNQVPVI